MDAKDRIIEEQQAIIEELRREIEELKLKLAKATKDSTRWYRGSNPQVSIQEDFYLGFLFQLSDMRRKLLLGFLVLEVLLEETSHLLIGN